MPLGIKPTLTLGRGESCDLVLPHRGVSKVHGIIKVRGKALFYEDEGSSNGTLLNGLRVPGCPLRPGDVLTLGPYEVEVCSNDEMARRNADDQSRGTKVLELTAGPPGTVLSGNLHEVPLTELFQALEFNRRSGTLTVFAKGFLGTLILAEGRPLTAYCEDQADTEAVCAMLALDSGRFELNNEAADVEPTMDCTLTSLLFEASRRADEGGRGGSAA